MRVLFILLQAVIVQPPSATIVPTLQGLHEVCGPGAFDACTLFVAYRLDVHCVTGERGAAMNASVTFKPMVLLHDIRQMPHELMHVDDVRTFAAQYVGELESRTFESDRLCEEEALRLTAGFGDRIRGFARRSNLMRHPSLRAGRSTISATDGR